MSEFLSIPEEILLMSLDDTGGIDPQSKTLDVVLAAAVLMDLALKSRIDSDLSHMIPVSEEPTNDPVLDDALKMIFREKELKPSSYWIMQLGMRAEEMKEILYASLVLKKILKVENKKVLWMVSSRKYPLVGDKEVKEVKSRVRELVQSEEFPELRDMVIVSLIFYGSMLPLIFSDPEIGAYHKRIEQLAKMDLIGQAIGKALEEYAVSFSRSSKAKSMLGIKTPEQKLLELVDEIRTKYRIRDDEDLPPWLRKGTSQYTKTLEFIRKNGTNDIFYHHGKDEYFVRTYAKSF